MAQTTFPIPSNSIIAPGVFTFGPVTLSQGINKIDCVFDVSPSTNNCTLSGGFQVSYDGGTTYQNEASFTGVVITNGTMPADGGGTQSTFELIVGLAPNANRTKVKFAGTVSGSSLKTGPSGSITLS